MARFVTGNTFGTTDTVTAALLNQAVNDAAISTDSVDNSTIEVNSNALRLKDSSSKTTGVTFAKMQHISTAKVLGRVSASEGDVEEAFDFKDEDDMSSNSATALASQQSIKKYVDDSSGLKASTATGTLSATSSFQDLDLSSVVGSNKAMVIMEVFDGSINARYIVFRTKGSSVEAYGSAPQGANATLLGTANNGGTVVVTTDSSGVIEYQTPAGSTTGINYAVQAFQKIT